MPHFSQLLKRTKGNLYTVITSPDSPPHHLTWLGACGLLRKLIFFLSASASLGLKRNQWQVALLVKGTSKSAPVSNGARVCVCVWFAWQWWNICLPTQEMQGLWARSLGQEDPLEKEMATRSSILAWRIPWTEEPGRLQSTGSQESDLATKPPPNMKNIILV